MDAQALTSGEIEVLIDGLTDDVSFSWVLDHLGLRGASLERGGAPSEEEIALVFTALERLTKWALIEVGRIDFIDGGPAGRVAPVRQVCESLEVVRGRVEECVARGDWAEWAFAFWVVNTSAGNEIAREVLATRDTV